ncbi:hypothetical protein C8Q74DRAFT_492156 [Fomes fomentarius]|nr:hypothetical protein C8Q74DRAFT_492156 [Fomes fomentarius]
MALTTSFAKVLLLSIEAILSCVDHMAQAPEVPPIRMNRTAMQRSLAGFTAGTGQKCICMIIPPILKDLEATCYCTRTAPLRLRSSARDVGTNTHTRTFSSLQTQGNSFFPLSRGQRMR